MKMVKKFKALVLIVMLLLVVGYTPYAAGSLYALELNNDKYNIKTNIKDSIKLIEIRVFFTLDFNLSKIIFIKRLECFSIMVWGIVCWYHNYKWREQNYQQHSY